MRERERKIERNRVDRFIFFWFYIWWLYGLELEVFGVYYIGGIYGLFYFLCWRELVFFVDIKDIGLVYFVLILVSLKIIVLFLTLNNLIFKICKFDWI